MYSTRLLEEVLRLEDVIARKIIWCRVRNEKVSDFTATSCPKFRINAKELRQRLIEVHRESLQELDCAIQEVREDHMVVTDQAGRPHIVCIWCGTWFASAEDFKRHLEVCRQALREILDRFS